MIHPSAPRLRTRSAHAAALHPSVAAHQRATLPDRRAVRLPTLLLMVLALLAALLPTTAAHANTPQLDFVVDGLDAPPFIHTPFLNGTQAVGVAPVGSSTPSLSVRINNVGDLAVEGGIAGLFGAIIGQENFKDPALFPTNADFLDAVADPQPCVERYEVLASGDSLEVNCVLPDTFDAYAPVVGTDDLDEVSEAPVAIYIPVAAELSWETLVEGPNEFEATAGFEIVAAGADPLAFAQLLEVRSIRLGGPNGPDLTLIDDPQAPCVGEAVCQVDLPAGTDTTIAYVNVVPTFPAAEHVNWTLPFTVAGQVPIPAPPAVLECGGLVPAVFSDVDPGSTHGPAIGCLGATEIFGGFGDGTFGPSASISRAQVASVLFRAMNAAGAGLEGVVPTFDDVAPGATHALAIGALAEVGVITGFGDGTFRPGDPVSRAQLSTMSLKAAAELGQPLPAGAVTFDDVVPGSTHAAAIGALSAAEIVNGFPDNIFRPSHQVSRAQTATMLVNWLTTLTI